jgi:hypothetical protein
MFGTLVPVLKFGCGERLKKGNKEKMIITYEKEAK